MREKLKALTPAQIEILIINLPMERDEQDVKYKKALEEMADAKYKLEYEMAVARMKYEDKKKKVDYIKAEITTDEEVKKAQEKLASLTAIYEGEKLKKKGLEDKLSTLQSLIKLKALDFDRTGKQ